MMNSIVQTPTPNLQQSLDFYAKLNFKTVSNAHPNFVSDGKVVLEINEDRYARAGVKLFRENWKTIVAQLEALTAIVKTKEGYLLNDPSGAWIYLMETEKPNLITEQIPPSVLGSFAGVSLESIDIHQSIKIWKILGFSPTMGSVEQGWISLADDAGMAISIMKAHACPHLFFNPSLSYFNGKNNLAIIEKIRDLKIPITEEITFFNKEGIVDNIIIRDPGGFGFFIFSD